MGVGGLIPGFHAVDGSVLVDEEVCEVLRDF